MPTLTHSGLRHFFRLEGRPDAAPLVLAHPIGADHGLWDAVVPGLLAHFQVLRYDLRGHGGTETAGEQTTLDDLSGDLLRLTHALGWEQFAVCGVSVGGMAALHAATRAPARVRALALCSTAARMPEPPGGWDSRAAAARRDGMAALAQPMVERMFSPAFRQSHPEVVETARSTFVHTDPQGYAACLAVLRDADLRPALASVRAPTLVMSATLDMALTSATPHELQDGIAGAQRVNFEGCGHFPPLEQADRFVRALSDFLRR